MKLREVLAPTLWALAACGATIGTTTCGADGETLADGSGANAGGPAAGGDAGGPAAGGMGGAGGTGAECVGCGALEECYAGQRCVATSVPVPGAYSIDATETTLSQYQAWLLTNPSHEQPPACAWNADFEPACDLGALGGDQPIVCVDWCDAYAYCAASGKRLCGRIGGGPNNYNDAANASVSQWYATCSQGGQHLYPYGDTYNPTVCNGFDLGIGWTVEVGSLLTCESYPGVYDLSGNVWEMEDSCDGDTGPADLCRMRGGSIGISSDTVASLRCDYAETLRRDNPGAVGVVGFRCCSSP